MQRTKVLCSPNRVANQCALQGILLSNPFTACLRLIMVWVSLLVTMLMANAQTTYTWNGATSLWGTPGNWSPSGNISQSFLEWSGSNGLQVGVNDANLKGANFIRRMVFLPNVTQSYTISGDTIQLEDPRIAPDAESVLRNSSAFNQQVQAPLLFNGNGRIGLIVTDSTGEMTVGKIILGPNLSFFRAGGANANGIIKLSDKISGNRPVFLALNGAGQLMPNSRIYISGNNSSFVGPLRMNAGITRALSDTALGYTAQFAEVSNGATLELAGNINLSGRPILINGGNGVSGKGSISNASDNNRIVSHVLVASNSAISSAAGTLVIDSIGKLSGVNWNIFFNGLGDIRVKSLGAIGLNPSFNALNKSQTGTLFIDGPSTHVGPTIISNGGNIVLGGNQFLPSNNVNNALDLFNGNLRTGGYSQNFRQLRLSGRSNIYLGTSNPTQALRFYASNTQNWGNDTRLIIHNWQGTSGSSGTMGKIFIGKDTANGLLPGLTDDQLSRITFNGFCDGALLLSSGELVPRFLPAIKDVRGLPFPNAPTFFPGGTTGLENAGYVGYTIKVMGCGFNSATEVKIGNDIITTFTILNDNELTFVLGDNQKGIIGVTNIAGVQLSAQPFTNLGYINSITGGMHSMGNTWLGSPSTPPPADRSLTIWRRTIIMDDTARVNDLESLNTVTLLDALGTSDSYLKLSVPNAIQDGTQLIMQSGWLFTHSGENMNPATGTDQFFKEFRVSGTMGTLNISLGKGRHDLRFGKCDTLGPLDKRLLIHNWKGAPLLSGDSGRIFFGNNAFSLTPAQLRQIQFVGFCPGATLLPTGELVPAASPFISNVADTTGRMYAGYIGTKIRLEGCQLDDVNKITIGNYEIQDFTFIPSENAITFFVEPNIPSFSNGDTLRLLTSNPNFTGVGKRFRNLGYLSSGAGNWSDPSKWYGNSIPLPGKNVTLDHAIDADIDISSLQAPDSIIVNSSGILRWNMGKNLTAMHLVNDGSLIPAAGSALTIKKNGTLRNRGTFDSQGFGTVNFLDSAQVIGTATEKPGIFHNLVINNGVVTLPSGNNYTGTSPLATMVTGALRINGGRFSGDGIINFSLIKYAPGSSLIYATGTEYSRGPEWFRSSTAGDNTLPGYPFNVIIDNNTFLNLDNIITPEPNYNPRSLVIGGDLRIINGRLNNNYSFSNGFFVDTKGNFQLGSDTATTSTGVFKYSRYNNSLRIGGNLVKYPNGSFDFLVGANPSDLSNYNRQPIHFEGTQNSVISTPGQDMLRLNSVLINKNPQATLNTILEVTDSITFLSGVLNTSHTHYLLLKTTAKANGGNINSFNNGPMRKETAGSPANAAGPFRFPVGKKIAADNLRFSPVWIADLKHDSGPTTYEAEYFTSATNESPFAGVFTDPSLQATWKFDWWEVRKVTNASNPSVGARIGIPYAPGKAWTPIEPCSGCNVAVVKYFNDENSWKFTKPPYMFNNSSNQYNEELGAFGSGMVYSDVMYSFSPFTIGTGFSELLNTRLLAFTAQLEQGNQAYLNWEVDNIDEVESFGVEYSATGSSFRQVGQVSPTAKKSYSFRYPNLLGGDHYFRLKLQLKNGVVAYSKTELLQVGVFTTRVMGIVGNPVLGNTAMLDMVSARHQKCEVMVVDASGRKVWAQSMLVGQGKNLVPLTFGNVGGGYYFMQVITEDGVQKILPFVKQ